MSRSYRVGKVTVTVPDTQGPARRERNWQRKYASAMFATEELRRLHRAIVKLSQQDLQSIEDLTSTGIADPKAVPIAVRRAAEILGIRTAHDVMFLSYYAAGGADGPGQAALSRAALAVASLPGGLQQSDYELLVTPVASTLPWLLQLRDEA
jgi:cytochrome P450